MGLGTSFLTLVVAENVGVKSGLGWYVSWAQGWAEYGKVYGALIIMAAFFSTIMTVLFQGARPRACLAKGSYQMVAVMTEPAATEASSLRVRGANKYFPAINGAAVGAFGFRRGVALRLGWGARIDRGPQRLRRSTLLRLVAGLILATEARFW